MKLNARADIQRFLETFMGYSLSRTRLQRDLIMTFKATRFNQRRLAFPPRHRDLPPREVVFVGRELEDERYRPPSSMTVTLARAGGGRPPRNGSWRSRQEPLAA